MPSRLSRAEILKICADENFGLFSKVVQAELTQKSQAVFFDKLE